MIRFQIYHETELACKYSNPFYETDETLKYLSNTKKVST